MLRAVGAGCKGARSSSRSPAASEPFSLFEPLRAFAIRALMNKIQKKLRPFALAAFLQPERIPRNAETDTLTNVPDFYGSGGARASTGRHGFPASRATRSAARPLAFRLRNRQNRPLHRRGPRLQQSVVRGHRPHRLDDSGLSLFRRRCLPIVWDLHEGLGACAALSARIDLRLELRANLLLCAQTFWPPGGIVVGLGVGILPLRGLLSRGANLEYVVVDRAV